MSLTNFLIALVVVTGLAACGEKKAPESAADAEMKRELMRTIDETATIFSRSGRHDKQYYIDRFAETISSCTRGPDDLDMSCFNNGLEKIKSE